MLDQEREKLRAIKTFPSLVKYLCDELNWPIETDNFEDLVFDYEAEELGIDPETAVKIDEIKQLRPLVSNQPWGIFFIKFEPKRLPVVVLRRILSRLVIKKRASAIKSEHASWDLDDLLFISNYGEDEQRQITFAHFSQDKATGDLPTLKVLGWDDADTALHLDHCHQELKGKLCWPDEEYNLKEWREKWSSAFVLRHREVITTSKDLAMRLADLARRIRSRANSVLAIETAQGQLRKLYKAFQEALIHDLGEDDFADMYAQTIAYGLLAARVSRPMGVTADNITDMIPITNPFLKEMLGTFLTAGGRKGAIDFDELGVQEVVELLNSPDTHMDAILRDFGNRTQQEDPVIHFYELFLSEYDKKKKVQRGIFYTPQPVVSYIVRSVHELLQGDFGLEDGLADITTWGEMVKRKPDIKIPEGVSPEEPFVQILDPATGTATFLVEVIDIIFQTMRAKWIKQGHMALETQSLWNEYVPKHLLPRLHGFELMMAPYAIAHMKLGLKLFETGYTFNTDERVHVYLTNSLEPATDAIPQRVFEQWSPALAHEAKAVNEVKCYKRFTVIVGNPPYSLISANMEPEHRALVERFKYIGDDKITERGALQLEKILNDDYVKFVAKSQDLLNASGLGLLGFITNHAYLDNPTMRAFRYSLLSTFRGAYLYDLGGSAKKSGDEVDENVFDIQQGVAIGILIKESDNTDIYQHARIFGTRENKYHELIDTSISKTQWTKLNPDVPFYLFIPTNYNLRSEYERYASLSDIFILKSIGLFTSKDSLVIDWDAESVKRKVGAFQQSGLSNKELCDQVGITAKQAWDVTKSRQRLKSIHDIGKCIVRFLHRPFDYKYMFYDRSLVWSMAWPVNRNMLSGNNLALAVSRQLATLPWNHVFCSNTIVELCYITNKTKEGNHIFPLYVLPVEKDRQNSFFIQKHTESNFRIEFLRKLTKILKLPASGAHDLPQSLTPEKLFQYIYAVFHSPTYRTRYSEFLKIDFPRLPLTSNLDLFRTLSKLGGELVDLHLMESPRLNTPVTKWHGSTPSNEVEKVIYSDETVWIDKGQTEGFRGVPENVWNFHIGGYQVCEKWLKDRKGRILSAEDITHYQKIAVTLNETIRLMKEIDEVIEKHGGWPGAFIASEE